MDAELLSASSVQDGVLCLEVGSVPLLLFHLGVPVWSMSILRKAASVCPVLTQDPDLGDMGTRISVTDKGVVGS